MSENNTIRKEMTIDDLVRIVQGDLLEIKTNLKEVQSGIANLETDVQVLKADVAEIKTTVENIETNLNKKVDKFTHNDLEYRVEKLEKKFA